MRTSRAILFAAAMLIAVPIFAQQSGVVDLRTMLPIPGGSVRRPILSKLGERLSVRDFGAACDGVTDDSPAIYTAMSEQAGTGRAVLVPADCRLNLGPAARLAGHRIALDGSGLVAEGGRDSGDGAVYGTRGGTILLTDTAAAAFIVKRNWRLERLTFYWPGQNEAAAVANGGTPVTMPPLVTGEGGAGFTPAEVSSGTFSDNDVINASRVLDFGSDPSGGLHVERNRAFFEDSFLRLATMPLESWVNDNDFTPNAFQSAPGMLDAGSTHTLINWAGMNAASVDIVGDGTATTASTTHVDGLSYHHNTTFGLGYGIRVAGGTLNLFRGSENIFDGTAHPIAVGTGGKIVGASSLSGGVVYSYTFGQPTNPSLSTPVVSVSADSAPNSALAIDDLHVASASGPLIDWEGSAGTLDISNVTLDGVNDPAGANSIVRMNTTRNGRLRINGSRFACNGGLGVEVGAPLQFMTVTANEFTSCSANISLGGSFATPNLIVGNYSLGTTGATAYAGSQASSLSDLSNSWDKPGPNWEQSIDGRTGGLQFAFQGVSKLELSPSGSLTPIGALNAPDLNIAGTGSAIAAWTQVTLAASPLTGSFTNVTAGLGYRKTGRMISYSVHVDEKNIGTATGFVTLSGLPFAQDSGTYCVLVGKEVGATGKGITMTIAPGATRALIAYTDGTFADANGLTIVASGTCQPAT
jgi:hypothetical protein